MAPKFALFTKGSKLPLNKGLKKYVSYYSLALNPRFIHKNVSCVYLFNNICFIFKYKNIYLDTHCIKSYVNH